MAARYTVLKDVSALPSPLENMGVKLTVTVSQAEDGVPAILLFDKRSDTDTKFLGVCSPLDLAQLPEDMPAIGLGRDNKVELTFRNEQLLDIAWAELIDDVYALAAALGTLETLASAETKTYGEYSITRDAVVAYPADAPTQYRLRVECTAGLDLHIFLYEDEVPDSDGTVKPRPVSVCSPGDMVDYPQDAAGPEFPFHYRRLVFDISTSNITLLADTWNNIQLDVEDLATALAYHETTVTTSTEMDIE